MRKRRVWVLCWVLAPVVLVGQNLVPNGSFEDYVDCPFSFGQWAQVEGWTSPYNFSADYFNRCAGGVVCSVPYNNMGYQEPAEGDAYMGLATYVSDDPLYREIIAAALTQPLQVGIPVYLSFKASPGGFGSWVANSANWKAKGPGIQFFNGLPQDWAGYLYPNSAALHMLDVLGDTSTWVTVSGVYTPDSAYTHLAITNFFEDSLSSPMFLDSVGTSSVAYAFIDQVCVSYDPQYCANWTGLASPHRPIALSAQNPIIDQLELRSEDRTVEGKAFRLMDQLGRMVWQGVWPAGVRHWQVPMPSLAEGGFLLTAVEPLIGFRPIKLVHVSP